MAEEKRANKKTPQKGSIIGRLFTSLLKLLVFAVFIGGVVIGAGAWWLNNPVTVAHSPVEVEISSGTSPRGVVQAIVNAGVDVQPELLYQYFRWSGQSRDIRAGNYEFTAADTPYSILQKLLNGSEITRTIVFPEGITFAQIRQRLNDAPDIKHDTVNMTDAQIMEALGKPGQHPEGLFFPDTYVFSKGSSDLQILRRAMQHMESILDSVWQERDADVPLKTPYEALILASIIEKETGRPQDRFMVAGVFTNRLRRGMLLQTDPTVIYGLGDAYTGRITRRNLDTDTPYNTYTRMGLTPTPIAMPGKDSLLAAVHPAKTNALYFVSRGDGSSHFSNTLSDHNRAVDHYIRGRATPPRPSSGIIEP